MKYITFSVCLRPKMYTVADKQLTATFHLDYVRIIHEIGLQELIIRQVNFAKKP